MAGLALAIASSAGAKDKPVELKFGKEPWRLVLTLPGMKKAEGAPSRPGRQIFTFSNDKTMTMLSVIVEDGPDAATLESCRDVHQRRARALPASARATEQHCQRGEAEVQEYSLPIPIPDKPILQQHFHSCRVRGNYYIDTHVSRMMYETRDHDALIALLDAVAIVE